jgi:hypothetical protein
MRRVLLFATAAVLARFLPPFSEILGDQVAGSIWAAMRLSSPWLSQVGDLAGALVGGAVAGLALRIFAKLRVWPAIAASLAVIVVYLIYLPATLLAAPVAAGLCAFVQNRSVRWVRGAVFAGGLTAMAHLLPIPQWGGAALSICAGLACAFGAPI